MSKPTKGGADISTPLSPDVIQAITILQERCGTAINTMAMEQCEHGLDELIRHPHRIGDPQKMAYSALRNGRKFTYDRIKIVPTTPYQEKFDIRIDSHAQEHQLICDIKSFIDSSDMDQLDRKLLRALLAGYHAEDIAQSTSLPLARVRVWISRARKKALRTWCAI